MRAMRRVPHLALALAAVACEGAATGSPPTSPHEEPVPQLDYLNGPVELPNVFRWEAHLGFSVRDPETKLAVWAGAPAHFQDLTLCGGAIPLELSAVQDVGGMTAVMLELRTGRDLTIDVLDTSLGLGCRARQIATGVGRAMRTDNDVWSTLTRTNSYGVRITGEVTAIDGRHYRVNAESRFLIFTDGSFEAPVQRVQLTPIGG